SKLALWTPEPRGMGGARLCPKDQSQHVGIPQRPIDRARRAPATTRCGWCFAHSPAPGRGKPPRLVDRALGSAQQEFPPRRRGISCPFLVFLHAASAQEAWGFDADDAVDNATQTYN